MYNDHFKIVHTVLSPATYGATDEITWFPLFRIITTSSAVNTMFGTYLISCSRRSSSGYPSIWTFGLYGVLSNTVTTEGKTLFTNRYVSTDADQCVNLRTRWDNSNGILYIDGGFSAKTANVNNEYRFYLQPLGAVEPLPGNTVYYGYDWPAKLVNPVGTILKTFDLFRYYRSNEFAIPGKITYGYPGAALAMQGYNANYLVLNIPMCPRYQMMSMELSFRYFYVNASGGIKRTRILKLLYNLYISYSDFAGNNPSFQSNSMVIIGANKAEPGLVSVKVIVNISDKYIHIYFPASAYSYLWLQSFVGVDSARNVALEDCTVTPELDPDLSTAVNVDLTYISDDT